MVEMILIWFYWVITTCFKITMLIVFLYYFGLIYQGWLLTFSAIAGIFWVLEDYLDWGYTLEKLERKENQK